MKRIFLLASIAGLAGTGHTAPMDSGRGPALEALAVAAAEAGGAASVPSAPVPGTRKPAEVKSDTAAILYNKSAARSRDKSAVGDDIPNGRGFNTIEDEPAGDCVYTPENQGTAGKAYYREVGGRAQTFFMYKTESLKTLSRHLNVSASAAVNWLTGSVSAKTSYLFSREYSSYELLLLAGAIVKLPTPTLMNTGLIPGKFALLSRDPRQFLRSCGDRFIRSHVKGGEMYALIRIRTRSATEKREIEGKLTGAFGMFSGSAELANKIKEVTKDRETSIFVYRSGGDGVAFETTPDKLTDMVTRFPAEVNSENGFILDLELADYDFLDLPESSSPIDLDRQRKVIKALADASLQVRQEIADIDYILDPGNQGQFKDPDIGGLTAARGVLAGGLRTLTAAADTCREDHDNCRYADPGMPYYVKPECSVYTRKQDPSCGTEEVRGKGNSMPGCTFVRYIRKGDLRVGSIFRCNKTCPVLTGWEACGAGAGDRLTERGGR